MLIGINTTLKEYLILKKMSLTDFAKLVDFSRTYLTAVLGGRLKPGPKLLRAIERVTENEVTSEYAFSDVKKYCDKKRDNDMS